MTRRYIAQYWKRSTADGSWSLTRVRAFKTQERARRQAVAWLKPIVTTNALYHFDRGRSDYCDIRDAKRSAQLFGTMPLLVDSVSPAVDVVLSVGELGWTP